MSEFLSAMVPVLAMALLHFLWQGLLVGVAAGLSLSALRGARPQARYAVACVALLACVLLPAGTVAHALLQGEAFGIGAASPSPGAAALQGMPQSARTLALRFAPPFDALPWVVAAWAAGAGVLSLRMACGWLWVQRLCRDAQRDAEGRWQACVDRLSPRLGIRRDVALRLVTDGEGPVTAGWLRPVVLLPVAVATRMPADLIEALLAHELAHVRRHDYLVNLLQGAAEALLFYHPVVWWLSQRIRVERELVADDLAGAAIGDRRRLALALSELDRHGSGRSPTPRPHYAPAAHGGHLMSRIKQLVSPQRSAPAGSAALPLIGLVLAGAAFIAHARMTPEAPPPSAQSTPAPSATATPAVAAEPLPTPAAQPGARVLPAAPAAPTPRARRVSVLEVGDGEGYAIVRAGEDGYTMSGDDADRSDIEAARRAVAGDFLWFRRDGKAWVVSDPRAVAQARAAWASMDRLTGQMHQLEARMKPHADELEALGERMAALHVRDAFDTPEMRAAQARIEALGERLQPLVEQQVALGLRMNDGGAAAQERMARQAEALARHQEAIAEEMEIHAEAMEAAAERMAEQHAPLEAMAREMALASEPMEAVGEEMAALGERIGERSRAADARVRTLIDEAYRDGRARPVQTSP